MRTVRSVAAFGALLTGATLAGCSGGGSSALPPTAKHMAAVHFTMHWPAAGTVAHVRHRQFISPNTMSVVVEVNNDSSLTTTANNPSAGQPTTSGITVNAPAGNDVITISLYDKAGGTGNELGQATVTQNIVAGQLNSLSATIDGLVTSVDLQPLPGQATVLQSTDGSGAKVFTLAGDLGATFVATAKDADGNIIVGPGDPITYSAGAVNTALSVTPVAGHTDEFAVAPGSTQSTHPVGVMVQAADGQGGNAQSNYTMALSPLVYVAYHNAGIGSVAAVLMDGTRLSLPGTFPGVVNPTGLAIDSDNHRIYVVDASSNKLLAFNEDGSAASGFTPAAVPNPVGVAYDSNNHDLYVAQSSNAVSEFHADGTPVSVSAAWANLSTPVGIAAWMTGDAGFQQIMVANAGNNTVSRYNEDGTPGPSTPLSRQPYYTTGMPPAGIAANAVDGYVYFDGTDSTGTQTLTAVPGIQGGFAASTTTGLSGPTGLAYDALDDSVLVANGTSGDVTIYDAALAGLTTTIHAPTGLSTPVALGIVY